MAFSNEKGWPEPGDIVEFKEILVTHRVLLLTCHGPVFGGDMKYNAWYISSSYGQILKAWFFIAPDDTRFTLISKGS
jgi:hypothetical protein